MSLLDHSLRLLQHQFNVKMIVLRKNYTAQPDTVQGTTRSCSRCS